MAEIESTAMGYFAGSAFAALLTQAGEAAAFEAPCASPPGHSSWGGVIGVATGERHQASVRLEDSGPS